MALTPKQALFVQEYMVDLNASQAALRAGYSPDTAPKIGSENLQKPEVQEAIAAAQAERSSRTKITIDRVLTEIARLAFNDPRNVYDDEGNILPVKQWSDEVAACVSSIKIKRTMRKDGDEYVPEVIEELRFWDKNSALEKAGKHLCMFIDKLKVSGDADEPLRVEHTDIGRASRVAALLDEARKRRARPADSSPEGVGPAPGKTEGSN